MRGKTTTIVEDFARQERVSFVPVGFPPVPQIWSLHFPVVHSERASVPPWLRCNGHYETWEPAEGNALPIDKVAVLSRQNKGGIVHFTERRPYKPARVACALDRDEKMMMLSIAIASMLGVADHPLETPILPLESTVARASGCPEKRKKEAGLVEDDMPATRLPGLLRSLGLGPIQNGSSCTVKGWPHSWHWVLKQVFSALRPEAWISRV